MFSATASRVPDHTPDHLNRRIWEKTRNNVIHYAKGPASIGKRLETLDREWDIERLMETNAAIMIIIGILLGVFVSPWFLVISFVVAGFFLQHALQGWCPPIRLLRRIGLRTQNEIASEYYALRYLRGDFKELPDASIDTGSILAVGQWSETAQKADRHDPKDCLRQTDLFVFFGYGTNHHVRLGRRRVLVLVFFVGKDQCEVACLDLFFFALFVNQ